MRLFFLQFVLVASIVNFASCRFIVEPGPRVKQTRGEVWPKPQQQKTSEKLMVLRPDIFHFEAIGQSCKVLQLAFMRYKTLINNLTPNHKDKGANKLLLWTGHENFAGFLDVLEVNVKEPCLDNTMPAFNMDEAYILNVNSPRNNFAILSANNVWGALRGLETFSQLLHRPSSGKSFGLIVKTVEIKDYPRFSHRGLLIDTSRHYLPVRTILENLSAMEYNKLNVLHWHIVDDQSFPFESKEYPALSHKGAYDKAFTYKPEQVQEIIEYARLRGIRVIPEFDTPGHTRSWGIGYPHLLTPCYTNNTPTGQYGPLDPTKNETYEFVENLFKELKTVFPDAYMHLGGDEVELSCWEGNPDIKQYMVEHGIADVKKLEEYYIQRLVNATDQLSIKSVVWEEVYTDGAQLSKDTVVHVWKGDSGFDVIAKATKEGFPVLQSACWYLDHLYTGGDWQKFYKCDPHDFPGNYNQKKLVYGGEACMWGESVNVYNVLQRIWPRASAVAEKLWSTQNADTIEGAARRLEEHTCRMNVRGIPAQPANGPGVCIPALKQILLNAE